MTVKVPTARTVNMTVKVPTAQTVNITVKVPMAPTVNMTVKVPTAPPVNITVFFFDMTPFVLVHGTDVSDAPSTMMLETARFFGTSAQCTRLHDVAFHSASFKALPTTPLISH
jgi:hypothetical protein